MRRTGLILLSILAVIHLIYSERLQEFSLLKATSSDILQYFFDSLSKISMHVVYKKYALTIILE